MAVNLAEKYDGRLIEAVISGKLEKDDYEHFVPKLEEAMKRHGKIRMLVQMVDFHGWSAGALWEDLKFDIAHFSDIDRLALVGHKSWEEGMAVFCKPFTTAKIRYFDSQELDAAHEWIEADLHESGASTGQQASST